MHAKSSITSLRGIGPKTAELFNKGGINTVTDLLNVMPKDYLDLRNGTQISNLKLGQQAMVVGHLIEKTTSGYGSRQRCEVLIRDQSDYMSLVFFHFANLYILDKIGSNGLITIIGQTSFFNGRAQMTHPRIYEGDKTAELGRIVPVYSELQGMTSSEIQRHVKTALDLASQSPPLEPLPNFVCEKMRISQLKHTYFGIHTPENSLTESDLIDLKARTAPCFRRLAFDELLAFQLVIQGRRLIEKDSLSNKVDSNNSELNFANIMSFLPTNAQSRAIDEIFHDLASDNPMLRMLQGDVGSGKTAVAMMACIHTVRSGFQCALMAPTEILAQQHVQTFQRICQSLDIKIILLTGSLTAKQRREALLEIENGTAHIAIGTHALLSEDVIFNHLALCIIDEQHRFGVLQRNTLRDKGKKGTIAPHLLVMTATPIPRSLAFTHYGDLDLSILNEMPPGRTPVETAVYCGDPQERAQMILEKIVSKNGKSYVVYPLIEESEKMDLANAKKGFEKLQNIFGEKSVGLLHGKMKSAEKEMTMEQFRAGEIQILVSTTVVEVGLDIKDANHMIIMNAERFGLSQLHQLRGRVGRGAKKSYCHLITKIDEGHSLARLRIMTETNDGFQIANADLKLRGPGEFLGTQQSGFKTFRFCDLARHADIIEPVKRLATMVLEQVSEPKYAELLNHYGTEETPKVC